MAKKPQDHPEHRLSSHVFGRNGLIERIITESGWWTAVETGTWLKDATDQQRFAHEERRKKRGIKPNALDGYVYGRLSGVMVHIELKYGSGGLTTGEEDTIKALNAQGILNACCWTVLEVYEFLVTTGLRIHGNARNIAVEVEARWRAADEAVRGASAPPKRKAASRPRTAKPTQAQLRQFAGVRARAAKMGILI
jgi:hypothetical protein